jgi:outer membrane receptor protein involved in Fe transport
MRNIILAGTALLALSAAISTPALADAANAAAADVAAPPAEAGADDPNAIIVTGATRAQRRFDTSYAINTITQDTVEKIAPVNFADLIGQLPGFQTEITGGEVQNIYRIRGLPNDGGFVNFQQDGLPLFHENDGVFFRGDAILKQDLMTDRVEVVRGGPAPVYASYSGAIINAITVTGKDTPRGRAQITLGDTGLYRLDAYQAGPSRKTPITPSAASSAIMTAIATTASRTIGAARSAPTSSTISRMARSSSTSTMSTTTMSSTCQSRSRTRAIPASRSTNISIISTAR